MKLSNFIIWLSVGAFVGWIASWMSAAERRRLVVKTVPASDSDS